MTTMTASQTKRCTQCARVLPLDAFGKVRADRDWPRPKCNGCEAERRRNARANGRNA